MGGNLPTNLSELENGISYALTIPSAFGRLPDLYACVW